MNNWFEVKVKYEKIDERGAAKKVTEPYVLDAMTFTEAEARAIQELHPYLNGEFIISNIARANYSELFPFDDGDRWFKCKIAYVSIDEEKGTEKRKATYVLVQANDVKHAWENLTKSMESYMGDYEVNSIQETAIMDVFPYSADNIASAPTAASPAIGEKVEVAEETEVETEDETAPEEEEAIEETNNEEEKED